MALSKKIYSVIIGTAAVGGGVGLYKFLSNKSASENDYDDQVVFTEQNMVDNLKKSNTFDKYISKKNKPEKKIEDNTIEAFTSLWADQQDRTQNKLFA